MIGVFDSGFGGLTILKEIRKKLPEYDYLYLGDNARAPYGTRSFDVVYEYTWQAVHYLLEHGCRLVILACNTASAKALRSIQQRNLIQYKDPQVRVLGVIRPTVEAIRDYTQTKHVGVVATPGTVASESYVIETEKQDPAICVTQEACPMWVPLIENNEHGNAGADYFVRKYMAELLQKDRLIDTIILGCTHYPLLLDKIRQVTPDNIRLLSQGEIVANSLADYLVRHRDLEQTLSKEGNCRFLTTECPERFSESARMFLGEEIHTERIEL